MPFALAALALSAAATSPAAAQLLDHQCRVTATLADGSTLRGLQWVGAGGAAGDRTIVWRSDLSNLGFAIEVSWSPKAGDADAFADGLAYITFALMDAPPPGKLRIQFQRDGGEQGMVLAGEFRAPRDSRAFAFTDWQTLRAFAGGVPVLWIELGDEADTVHVQDRIDSAMLDAAAAGAARLLADLDAKVAGDRADCGPARPE